MSSFLVDSQANPKRASKKKGKRHPPQKHGTPQRISTLVSHTRNGHNHRVTPYSVLLGHSAVVYGPAALDRYGFVVFADFFCVGCFKGIPLGDNHLRLDQGGWTPLSIYVR